MERPFTKKILDYEVHALLGKGSFSEVYEGRRGGSPEGTPLGRVAIKLMKPPLRINAEELLASLRYEFWVLKDLVHPNIVRLFDFGQLPDRRLYLVEEFVRGVPLNVYCSKRPFRECEPVFIDLLKALNELERWGLVHGDVKPANILVAEGPKGPLVKLLDFGMARPDRGLKIEKLKIENLGREKSSIFNIQSSIPQGGTPSTMAPEVILRRPSDHRSDLYSLGVCFYASLAGQNPFIGKNVEETLQAHLHKKAEPVGLFRRDVPPEWGDLIHRLLEKNPDERPASALKALSLAQKDIFVLSPSAFVGRKNLVARAMEIESGLTKGTMRALVVSGKKGIGVTRFLREIFYRLISAHPDLRDRIALVEHPPFPDVPILLIDRLSPPATHPAVTLDLDPLSVEEVTTWIGLLLNLPQIPDKFLKKMCALTGGHPQSVWDLLTLLSEKGFLADPSGLVTPSKLSLIDWESVLPGQEKAAGLEDNIDWLMTEVRRRISSRTLSGDDPVWQRLDELALTSTDSAERLISRARTLALKGEAAIDEGKFDRAKEALTAALEIFRASAGQTIDEIRVRNFLAYILLRQGKAHEAVREFESTLTIVRNKLTPEEARQITNLDLGLAYLQVGNFRQAISRLREELEFHRSLQSDPSPEGGPFGAQKKGAFIHEIGCLYNLAQSHSALRETNEAEKYYREVIDKAREISEPAFILRGLNGLGNLLKTTPRWEEGLSAYGEALELALALRDFSSATAAAQNRGSLAAFHGRHQEALDDLTESLKFAAKIETPYAFEKMLVCRSHVELGEVYVSLKRFSEGQDHLDRAWHLAEKDSDLADFRFWVLLGRCRLWKALDDTERFKQDLARLNFYADTDEKRKQQEELGTPTQIPPPLMGGGGGEGDRGKKIVPRDGTEILAIAPVFEAKETELTILLKITGDLLEDIPLHELLKKILTHAIRLASAEIGVILLAGEKGELTPTLSLNAELSEELCDVSLSVAKEVLTTGEILQAHDALKDDRLAQQASVIALNLRSIIGLPISFRGKVLGVLYLSHRYRPGLFDARITKILSAFADQVALALTNNRLLDFYRARQEEMKGELEETRHELTIVQEKIRSLPEKFRDRVTEGPIKTRSRVLLEILDQVERVAPTSLSLVIHGETGTGKELIARHAHEMSPRRGRPFVAINCGALPATLIEGELFGHAKGAFTGADRDKVGLIEAATGGTLFLDEIVDLPLEAQVKLLRVLQEREVVRLGETKPRLVEIRLIAASQKSIKEAVAEGKFREDLSFRLMGLEIFLPPLRERPEDIPLLAEFFLKETMKENPKRQTEGMAASFIRLLTQYVWPGNIRELKNVIATAAALTEGKVVGVESLPKNLRDQMEQRNLRRDRKGGEVVAGPVAGWYHPSLSWDEHLLLIYASSLIALNFNVPQVASSLGVGVATVYKWMREHRIRETAEEWKKKILPYREGTRLKEIRSMIFSAAAKRFPGHPYHAARELNVAPVTFYRWTR